MSFLLASQPTVDAAVLRAVERAMAELRRSASVLLRGPKAGAALVQAAEDLGPADMGRLGFRRVRLMTNNPERVAALTRCGIAVEERGPHAFPANGHNELYLAAKAGRGGHLF